MKEHQPFVIKGQRRFYPRIWPLRLSESNNKNNLLIAADICQDDEEMDGIEMTYNKFDVTGGDDMTFAPTSSSTQNFTAAARLASTPFNILADMAPLPEPPLSTIKPPTVTAGATRVQHQLENPRPADVTSGSESGEKRHSERFSIYVQQENLRYIVIDEWEMGQERQGGRCGDGVGKGAILFTESYGMIKLCN